MLSMIKLMWYWEISYLGWWRFFWIVVQFQRKVWSGKIHQGSRQARSVCDPEDWALHPSWMESWVHSFIFNFFIIYFLIFRESTHVENTMVNIHFWCPWLLLRGLPFWLREVKNMTFRTDNEPFKVFISLSFLIFFLMMTPLGLFVRFTMNVELGPYIRKLSFIWIEWFLKHRLGNLNYFLTLDYLIFVSN